MEMIYRREYNIKFFQAGDHFLFCICTGAIFKNVLDTGTVPEWSYGTYLPYILEGKSVADPDPTVPISQRAYSGCGSGSVRYLRIRTAMVNLDLSDELNTLFRKKQLKHHQKCFKLFKFILIKEY